MIATRPQFIIAYLIISLGALVMGHAQGFDPIDTDLLLTSISTVIIAAIGIHYRDEASDWDNGYDIEIGGMGVIRNGKLNSRELRRVGVFFNLAAFALIAFQIYGDLELLWVAVPVSIILIWPNYLTEEVVMGHEVFTAFSYWAALMWVYIGQGWEITYPILMFSVFIYIIAFALVPLQDIGDVEADIKSGKKTLTVRLGVDGMGHLSIFVALFSLLFLYYTIIILI